MIEEKLTDKQLEKREEIVKKSKKKKDYFKKKYGDDWKSVMYAIATKKAKEMVKENLEKLDEFKRTPGFDFIETDPADTKEIKKRLRYYVNTILNELNAIKKAVKTYESKANHQGPQWKHVNALAQWQGILSNLANVMNNRASYLSTSPIRISRKEDAISYFESYNEDNGEDILVEEKIKLEDGNTIQLDGKDLEIYKKAMKNKQFEKILKVMKKNKKEWEKGFKFIKELME